MDKSLYALDNKVRPSSKLEEGITLVDKYIKKNYLINLHNRKINPISESRRSFHNLRFLRLKRFVYDKKENVNDKLISVYSALHDLNTTSLLIVHGDESGVDFLIGVRTDENESTSKKILENTITGNFPGSVVENIFGNSNIERLINDYIHNKNGSFQNVTSVSTIPSLRDEDKENFVQGIENFIDAMQNKEYTALFISSPISKNDLEIRKNGLEEIATSLSPYAKTTLAYGKNYSKAVTEGINENFSKTINNSISKTTGKSESESFGSSSGTSSQSFSGMSGDSYSSSYSKSWSTSFSETLTEGESNTKGTGKSYSTAVTDGDNKTVTVEYINKSIENLLTTIDDQLKRIKESESYGLWESAVYFLSPQSETSIMAANVYKSLVSGESTYVENSYINLWNRSNPNKEKLLDYLKYGYHPQFIIDDGAKYGYRKQIVTPGCYMSSKDLPLFMGLPHKSITGVTVNNIAEFGRNVYSVNGDSLEGNLILGEIQHMGKTEKTSVSLDVNSFTSHCFIAGSTGSGKSNTSYVLLNEFYKKGIPFLVIEPAKGEYKDEFRKIPGINIFTTNPKYGQLLRINPFWFDCENIHILEHLDRLIEIFNACWPMYAAMPAILKSAAERIYVEKGWDLLNSLYLGEGHVEFPTFGDLLRVLPEVIKSSAYSADTQGDYTGALVTRVASLTNGITGQIFCSGYALTDSRLFDENTIIDLSRVGSTETKALIMGLLVMKLTEYRTAQATGSNAKLRHITVLEEAHNLLKRTDTSQGQENANLLGKSVEMISNSIAEMRTYGEGFIIIDQSPTAVDISAIKNTNTKIIMRLPEKEDCEAVGNAMALNEEQVKELAKLPTGVAAVIQNNWVETILVKVKPASSEYMEQERPVNQQTSNNLKAVVVCVLMKQYHGIQKWDKDELKDAVDGVDIQDYKKKEIIDIAFSIMDSVEPRSNNKYFHKRLLELSDCKGVISLCEASFNNIDFDNITDKDYKTAKMLKNKLTQNILKVLPVDNHGGIVDVIIKTLLHGFQLSAEDKRWKKFYKMLYVNGMEK